MATAECYCAEIDEPGWQCAPCQIREKLAEVRAEKGVTAKQQAVLVAAERWAREAETWGLRNGVELTERNIVVYFVPGERRLYRAVKAMRKELEIGKASKEGR